MILFHYGSSGAPTLQDSVYYESNIVTRPAAPVRSAATVLLITMVVSPQFLYSRTCHGPQGVYHIETGNTCSLFSYSFLIFLIGIIVMVLYCLFETLQVKLFLENL